MPFFRSFRFTRRDALLIFVGALSTRLFASLFSPAVVINAQLDHYRPSIPPERHPTPHHPAPPAAPAPVPIDLELTLPETTIVSHAPGWTVFRNLYMAHGTLYVVSPHPRAYFPEIRLMTSTGDAAQNTPENIAQREPTSQHMDFISLDQANEWWGGENGQPNRVWSVEGNTLLFNDPSQFLNHYYHFVAELFFGAWAFWSGTFPSSTFDPHSLSTHHPVHAHTDGPIPFHRAIFAHSDSDGWRDHPGFNAFFLRAAFPSLTVEVQKDWLDRADATAPHSIAGRRAWHFPVVLLSDRSAAFRGEVCGSRTQRTASEAYEAMMGTGRLVKGWWEPVRKAVMRFAGAQAHQDRAIDTTPALPEKVVITYISRQAVKRRLIYEDHQGLVMALHQLVARKNRLRAASGTGLEWELNVVQAEKLTKDEQVRIVSKTTILLGVHGNGLTHLIWMPPTRVSAVIEIFYPGGFAHDYEWTTRALGMRHFAMWNDTHRSHPNEPDVSYPEGFQGTAIPVYGPAVADLIEDRVEGRL